MSGVHIGELEIIQLAVERVLENTDCESDAEALQEICMEHLKFHDWVPDEDEVNPARIAHKKVARRMSRRQRNR